ncbi:hypothetical protein [Persicobacter sp. CCB-QB2]|uniref:hypothetical protein n=1 Tax=Persicobacter sp. CCB-QB2 TaxID=1561025 RepID=UPI0006A9A50A|nr:hypothetical protein [Persicobacter sp. CCB-QB2]
MCIIKFLDSERSVINIIDEKRPDAWSSCYRCTAEFYQYTQPEFIVEAKDEDYYHPAEVSQRVNKDRSQNTIVFVIAGIVGFAIGYMLVQ